MDINQIVDDFEARAKAAGMSVAALCKKADVAQSNWARWRAGVTQPTLRTINRIEAALSLPTSPEHHNGEHQAAEEHETADS